jgi:hypothetical protein
MRKPFFLRIALQILLLLALSAGAYAQDDEKAGFSMPCDQVVKLGLEKFSKAYGDRTQDFSTAGQKQAFEYYVNCKHPADDALSAKLLTEDKQKQIATVRDELNKYGEAVWTLRYAEEGGGTMWGLIAANAYADREDFMATFIKTLAAPAARHSLRARRMVKLKLTRIQRWLSSPKRKPFTENLDPNDVVSNKKLYQDTMKEAQDALTQLRSILDTLPDLAAERLAARMAEETKNALADSP